MYVHELLSSDTCRTVVENATFTAPTRTRQSSNRSPLRESEIFDDADHLDDWSEPEYFDERVRLTDARSGV
jgi:hypothetical protein